MQETEDQPALRVLKGEALHTNRAPGKLSAVTKEPREARVQLGLPGVSSPRSALVCMTVQAMAGRGPRRWLCDNGIRSVVDLRIAPSFRRLHMRRREFVELTEGLGASYVHLLALANRHAGESWHEERYRQQLQRHFEDKRREVEMLREMIEDGPVLLIVTRNSSLELDLLLRALEQVAPGFELRVFFEE